jgi:1-acyl-sn-glycerol-3-phosphate acyltransferase
LAVSPEPSVTPEVVSVPDAVSAPGRHVPFEIDPRMTLTYRVLRGITNGLVRLWFRPPVAGRANIPAEGPVIIAPVHRPNLDFVFTSILTKRKLFFMAKDSLWKNKPLGNFLLAMGAFPVHRESADREALTRAEEVLRGGHVLVLFPEGSRQEGNTIDSLLEGASFIAARTGARVVPVGIGGSARSMPKGAKIPKPVKVTLIIGESLDPPERSAGGRVSRSKVHAATEELRIRLQVLYDRAER